MPQRKADGFFIGNAQVKEPIVESFQYARQAAPAQVGFHGGVIPPG
jgi:hypothetical protein